MDTFFEISKKVTLKKILKKNINLNLKIIHALEHGTKSQKLKKNSIFGMKFTIFENREFRFTGFD